jgi:hypothetical protein
LISRQNQITIIGRNMTTESKMKPDIRAPIESKVISKAVADGIGGMILAVAEVAGTPEEVIRALTTNGVELKAAAREARPRYNRSINENSCSRKEREYGTQNNTYAQRKSE